MHVSILSEKKNIHSNIFVRETPITKEEGIVIVFVMSQSDMWFIYICSSLMVVRLRCMCFYILMCAFQSGGLCRRLDGGVMAVFNKGEMCVFVGDGG